ncbi:NAC domain-containing protein 62-like [Tripterygium wilfordii]|uniref:NAC domain-containing protein 62-like n=1 Tax=Tripterygium wilfordii TaxID=458696 RepID=UPI0018F8173C|nr:NAC domain-containing protein 62-like [Tripterygium wilfordii]
MDPDQAVGFQFHPTDEQLIHHYLNLKNLGFDDRVTNIGEIEICNFEPWQLPERAVTPTNDYTWYFFTRPDYRYTNSRRANRITNGGYWKVIGKARKIVDGNNDEIGTKKTLVFLQGNVPKGVKTNWVIHEYHSNMNNSDQRDFVLCRLKKKPGGHFDDAIDEEGQPIQHNVAQQIDPQLHGDNLESQ